MVHVRADKNGLSARAQCCAGAVPYTGAKLVSSA
jgi:hypothetical protein